MIHLEAGRYGKFVVDGDKWYDDPSAAEHVSDPYGGKNSIVYVGVVPKAEPALTFDGWFESRLAKERSNPCRCRATPTSSSVPTPPGLKTFTELHAWKSLSLGAIQAGT